MRDRTRADWGPLTKDYIIREGADTKTRSGCADEGVRRRVEIPKVRWVNQVGEYKCVGRMRNVYIVKRDLGKGKGKGGR